MRGLDWVRLVEVKYNNLPIELAKYADVFDGKTAVFECPPNELRFATDLEININKFNI